MMLLGFDREALSFEIAPRVLSGFMTVEAALRGACAVRRFPRLAAPLSR